MKLIWTFTLVTLLNCSYTAADVYAKRTKTIYQVARNQCTLATPDFSFMTNGITVNLSQQIGLSTGERAWVGYIEDLEVFQYLGCVGLTNQTGWTSKKEMAMRRDSSIGQCQTFCASYEYFGVQSKEKAIDCYCIGTLDQKTVKTCDQIVGFRLPHGGILKVSVYKVPSRNISETLITCSQSDNETKRCLSLSEEKYVWEDCSRTHNYLCSPNSSTTTSDLSVSSKTWTEAANVCLNSGKLLSADILNLSYNEAIWLSYIKSEVILTPIGNSCSKHRKYGYIERNEENQFILYFGNPNNEYDSICNPTEKENVIFTNDKSEVIKQYKGIRSSNGVTSNPSSTQTTNMIEEKTNQALTGSRNDEMFTSTDTTDSLRVTSSTTSTQKTNMIQEKTSQNLSGSSNSKTSTSKDTTDAMRTHLSSTTHRMTVEIEGHDDTNKNEGKTSSNLGVIVGIPVGIFLLTVAVILVILYRKRRKSESCKRSKKNVDVDTDKALKVNKTNTTVNNAVYIEKSERDEMKNVENYVFQEKGWRVPTRKSINNFSSFVLENDQTYGMKVAKTDYHHISKASGQASQYNTCSSQEKCENENSANPINKKSIGYDYAKVIPRHGVRDAIRTSHVGCERFKTGADSDYDHLDKMNAQNKYKKAKYLGADTDIGNIYNKTGLHDVLDTYDHVDDGMFRSRNLRFENPSGNGNHSNTYNKLKYITHGDNDTYNRINRSKNFDKQIYFGTKAENMNKVLSDDPYDHSS